jgi:hypothetical protein
MILHGIFESWFESEEALVDGCGILAVERDHLAPRFAVSDADAKKRMPVVRKNPVLSETQTRESIRLNCISL